MSLLNPITLYRDKNITGSEGAIDLAALMLPANMDTPTAWAITAGDGTSQWSISGGVITPAGSGVTAGTYTLTIEATFANYPSPYNTSDQTLTIIVPSESRFVDPATGDDTGTGTKLDPWANVPGDPAATGAAASYAPGALALIVIKGGSEIRATITPPNNNLIYADGFKAAGWGATAAAIIGSDPLPAGTAVTSGEVFGNPHWANIKKWTSSAWGSVARDFAQYLIDRDDDSLVQMAQWPPAGADPYLDYADPQRQLTGGMCRTAKANIVFDDATSTIDLSAVTEAADLLTLLNGESLVGAWVGVWASPNEIFYAEITGHNTTTNVITFDTTGREQENKDPNAFQIMGHPLFITAAGQFAWSSDDLTVYAWTVSGSNIEMMARKQGVVGDSRAAGAVYGLRMEGFYGTGTSSHEASCIKVQGGTVTTWSVCGNHFRWCANEMGQGALIYVGGGGAADPTDWVVNGNTFEKSIRSSGVRVTSYPNYNWTITSNIIDRITRTGIYYYEPVGGIVGYNTLSNGLSAHGNSASIYNNHTDATGCQYIYNTHRNTMRPLTAHYMPNLDIQGCIFEMDGVVRDGVRFYEMLSSASVDRCAFMRRQNVTGSGEAALKAVPTGASNSFYVPSHSGTFTAGDTVNFSPSGASGVVASWKAERAQLQLEAGYTEPSAGDTVTGPSGTGTVVSNSGAGTISNCVIDGVAQGLKQTFTDCLVTQTGVVSANPIQNNVSPNSGNKVAASTAVWNGAFTPQMKQTLGVGRIGDRMLYGIAVISWSNVSDAEVNEVVTSGSTGSLLTTDGTKTLTVTGGEARYADDAAMTLNVSAWSGSHSVSNGKYVQLRTTSSTSNNTAVDVTADFGEGNVYTWTVTTARASGWPLVAAASGADWRITSATACGSRETKEATFLIPCGNFTTPSSTVSFAGQLAGGIQWFIACTDARRFRFILKNSAGAIICDFNTPTIPQRDVDVLVTIDLTAATPATLSGSGGPLQTDGVKVCFDGVLTALPSVPSPFSNDNIAWNKAPSSGATRIWGGAGPEPEIIGGFFLWDVKTDTSSATEMAKFTPLQIGVDGFTNPLGTAPLIAIVGPAAYWNAATLDNRGSGPDFTKNGSNVTTATGGSPVWPAFDYATGVTLSGPTDTQAGVPSTYTVAFNGSLGAEVTVNLSDGGAGGTFDTPSLVFPPEEDPTPQTFDYTPPELTLAASATGFAPGSLVINGG